MEVSITMLQKLQKNLLKVIRNTELNEEEFTHLYKAKRVIKELLKLKQENATKY